MVAEAITNYLASLGGYDTDSQVFMDHRPAEPIKCLVVHEYAGDPPSPFDVLQSNSFQVTVRDANIEVAKASSYVFYNALLPTNTDCKVAVPGLELCQIYLRGTPLRLEDDANGNAVYGFSIGVTSNIK